MIAEEKESRHSCKSTSFSLGEQRRDDKSSKDTFGLSTSVCGVLELWEADDSRSVGSIWVIPQRYLVCN